MSDDPPGDSTPDDGDDSLPGSDLGLDVGALDGELGPDEPSVSIPDTSDADASPELLRAFWGSVFAIKIGVIAATLGALMGYFRGRWRLAGLGIAIGVVALANAYRRYRGYQKP
ncbi:MAG: hypothetical protein BRD24_06895 [Halobacteriales archaeon SW_9_67_24]|nr:MAG: hypothetical protein BRD24_06895 [Halobacteriales archaeon SW_9_67_24]